MEAESNAGMLVLNILPILFALIFPLAGLVVAVLVLRAFWIKLADIAKAQSESARALGRLADVLESQTTIPPGPLGSKE